MKKIFYFAPPMIATIVYFLIGMIDRFQAIDPMVYVGIMVMIISGIILSFEKWYGCLLGIVVSLILINMSTIDTGQILNIELPVGIFLFIYYVMCGYIVYRQAS